MTRPSWRISGMKRVSGVCSAAGLRRQSGCRWEDRALEDLAASAFGKSVQTPHVARVFVWCDALAHEFSYIVCGAVRAVAEHDCGADLLTQAVVGKPDHGGLDDVGMGVEDFFDLAGINVVAVPQ